MLLSDSVNFALSFQIATSGGLHDDSFLRCGGLSLSPMQGTDCGSRIRPKRASHSQSAAIRAAGFRRRPHPGDGGSAGCEHFLSRDPGRPPGPPSRPPGPGARIAAYPREHPKEPAAALRKRALRHCRSRGLAATRWRGVDLRRHSAHLHRRSWRGRRRRGNHEHAAAAGQPASCRNSPHADQNASRSGSDADVTRGERLF